MVSEYVTGSGTATVLPPSDLRASGQYSTHAAGPLPAQSGVDTDIGRLTCQLAAE